MAGCRAVPDGPVCGRRWRSLPVLERVVVIEASAGTGKTFQLSNRYLGLLAHGVPPDAILATTFTRAAAGEIRERILSRLAGAVQSEEAAGELAEQIGMAGLSVNDVRRLLQRTVRRLHRMRIGTLDSFFGQLARSLALELNLPPDWEVVEPSAAGPLVDDAIRVTLRRESRGDLEQLFHRIHRGEAARSIAEALRQTVANFLDAFREAPDEAAWSNFPPGRRCTKATLQQIAEQLQRYQPDEDEQIDPRLVKAVRADAARLRDENWEEMLQRGLLPKIIDDQTTYYSRPIPQRLVRLYRRLARHVRAVVLDELRSATHATYDLLRRFSRHFERTKRRRAVFEFADVPSWLLRLWRQERLARTALQQTAFRMDTPIRHLLLDEFQDTSLLQWWVLEPLVEQVTGASERSSRSNGRCDPMQEGTFFCVGDSKQAIYRWRGGRAGILQELPRLLPNARRRPLNESFRSSGAVIDAVNQICESLADGARKSGAAGDHLLAAQRWVDNFPRHTARYAERPGYAAVEVARVQSETDGAGVDLLRSVAERVRELNDQCGGRTIGVLVRKNDEVAGITYHLRRLGVPCSELGGNPLTDAAPVEAILSALQLATHPADTTARYHVTHSPLGEVVGLSAEATAAQVRRWAAGVRRRLQYDGYDAVLADWAEELEPVCTRRERSRLRQLVRFARAFGDAPLRPDEFVRTVRAQRVPDPTADRICVMTIHQAKGLQFDCAVLVCPERSLAGSPGGVSCVVQQQSPTGPIERVCVYRGQKVQQVLPPELQRMFRDDLQARIIEELNLLYVGLTRAVYALHVIVAPQGKRQGYTKAARWICGGLGVDLVRAGGATADDGQIVAGGEASSATRTLWELGDRKWYREPATCPDRPAAAEDRGTPPAEQTVEPIRFAPRRRSRRGRRVEAPSTIGAGGRVNAASLLGVFDEASLRGRAMHKWCEMVGWWEDGIPSDARLLAAARTELGTTGEDGRLETWLQQWRRLLGAPRIRSLFSREHYCGPDSPLPPEIRDAVVRGTARLEVHNEAPFALADGARIVNGIIDRLVLVRSTDGSVCGADVIDFKTDRVQAGDGPSLRQHVERYTEQLRLYRRAVARLYGLPTEAIACRLVFLESGDVCSVDPQ
ncbi:MAG: hypothetical protein D6725_13150 [Planctomycetota bacterium]|nr:MAG: hypothetical protein D6725_13150 [Planctomycetota bacterium]